MNSFRRVFCLIVLSVCLALANVTSAFGQHYFTFQDMPSYMKDYFDRIDRSASDRNADSRTIIDTWKQNVENCFLAQKGRILPTGLSSGINATLVTSFTLTDASGNVGRSAAVPYAVFTAKISGGGQMVLGYICRDIKGVPMYAGKTTLSGGEATLTIRISTDGSRGACMARADAIGRLKTVQLLTEEEFEAHVLHCTGPSYNRKGFAGVFLDDTQGAAPSVQPTLYDNKLTDSIIEEYEDGVVSITTMTLSKKGEAVAVAYLEGENGAISSLEIVSPDIFILPDLNPFDGCVPIHVKSEPALILGDHRSKAILEENDMYYTIDPYVKLGVAWFSGFVLKEEMNGASSFTYKDVMNNDDNLRLILHW